MVTIGGLRFSVRTLWTLHPEENPVERTMLVSDR
jgi:hypothetical protein